MFLFVKSSSQECKFTNDFLPIIEVVKKTFRYPNVFFYYRNAFFLQPLMPQSFIPEHFYGKGYKSDYHSEPV